MWRRNRHSRLPSWQRCFSTPQDPMSVRLQPPTACVAAMQTWHVLVCFCHLSTLSAKLSLFNC